VKKSSKIEHYLISLSINPQLDMHCYLMSADRRYIEGAGDKMMDAAESMGFNPPPLLLATKLSISCSTRSRPPRSGRSSAPTGRGPLGSAICVAAR
jgi:hypothetical protein